MAITEGAQTTTLEPRTLRETFGWAIYDGADEISGDIRSRLEVVGLDRREVGEHVYEAFAATDRLGIRILGRWLATGEEITQEEGVQLSELGNLVDEVALSGLVKSYLVFEQAAVSLVEREGARLDVPQDLMAEAKMVMRVSTHASLVNMARRFDEARTRLSAELAREQAKLEHQALHDPLTGLANRTLLHEDLAQATAEDEGEAGLIFVDLDDFKSVNDSLGHEAGDRLLRTVADRLTEICRPGDTVARLGGDEFVVLCRKLDRGRDQVSALADRVLAALSHPVSVGERDVTPAASIGVACTGPGCTDPQALLANADAAMYVAKERGGRGQAVYDEAEGRDTARRARLRFGLRKALERGEIDVHYQPIADPEGRSVRGMEALARWSHPELGPIEPAEFIPLAEESGTIRAIDDWVLSTACAQAAAWHERGWDIGISVNVSAHHLDGDRLEQTVRAALALAALPAEALTLELTESRLMRDPDEVIDALERLAAIGVRIAIDDFGVGYSSLAYLRRLPVDSVKVDRSFIRGLGSPGGDGAVVAAIVELAHSLGLSVVAEGVENQDELEAVRALGCDEIQGFHLARPGPAADLASLRVPGG